MEYGKIYSVMKIKSTNCIYEYFQVKGNLIVKTLAWSILVCSLSIRGYTQERDCADLLVEAQDLYRNGREKEALVPLKTCLNNPKKFKQTSKEIRAGIHRMEALAYIILNEPDSAQIATMNMMAYWPFYEKEKRFHINDDLTEFDTKVKELHALPRFSVGVKGGGNLSLVNLIQPFSAFEKTQADPLNYSFRIGFQFNIVGEYLLTRDITLALEPGYAFQQLTYRTTYLQEEIDYSYKQNLTFLDIPLWLRYHLIPAGKLKPYLQAGAFYKQLLNSTKETTFADNASREIPVGTIMQRHYYGLGIGGGVTLHRQRSAFRIEVAWRYSLNLLNNPQKRYLNNGQNRILLYEYYDLSDDIRLNSLDINLIYLFAFNHKAFRR